MIIDGIELFEGSHLTNAVMASGPSFPSGPSHPPDTGELFFKTNNNDSQGVAGFYVYNGTSWHLIIDDANVVNYVTSSASVTYGTTFPTSQSLGRPLNNGELFYKTNSDGNGVSGLYYYNTTSSTWSLTQSQETLQTVTTRGASSSVATITLSANTPSTSSSTGNLVTTGGIGIGENANIAGNLNVSGSTIIVGDLTVNGTTTTLNSTTITVDDPILTIGGDTVSLDQVKARGIEAKWNGTSITISEYAGNGSNLVTATVSSTAQITNGDVITISGATGTEQSKLNGTWKVYQILNSTQFDFYISSNLSSGSYTSSSIGTTVKGKNAFFGLDQSTGKFTFIPEANNTGEVFTGAKGVIDAHLEWNDILNPPDFLTSSSNIDGGLYY